MAGMGHQKKAQRLEMACPSCKEKMTATLQGKTWKSTRLRSYWSCECGQERIRIKGSGCKAVAY